MEESNISLMLNRKFIHYKSYNNLIVICNSVSFNDEKLIFTQSTCLYSHYHSFL